MAPLGRENTKQEEGVRLISEFRDMISRQGKTKL